MGEPRIVDVTLFGEWDSIPESPGEQYLDLEILSNWDSCKLRSEWCMEHLEYTGDLMLEAEDHLLLRNCLDSYIMGLFPACIITADAFIERLVTDFLEARGLAREAKGSLGRKLNAMESSHLVDANVLQWLSRLHRIRNNLAHEKGPDDEFRLFRRSLAARTPWEVLIHTDAREAVSLAYAIAGRMKRSFPRLGLSV